MKKHNKSTVDDADVAGTTPTVRWRSLRRDLLDYCERDTWAMVRLVRTLEGNKAYKVPGGAKGANAAHPDGRPRRQRGPAPQRDFLTDLLAPEPPAKRRRR